MKTLILLTFFCVDVWAGTLTVRNNEPVPISYNCELDNMVLSDYFSNIFELSCDFRPDPLIQNSIFKKSHFMINGQMTLSCSVYHSEFYNDDFLIILDCKDDTVFNSGFD